MASAHADPAGPGSTGSGVRSRHHPVNTARTASTRPAKRRSQPRTVSAGRPSNAAINRCPAPVAFAVKPAPITAAVSARRTSNTTGNSTCVARQPVAGIHCWTLASLLPQFGDTLATATVQEAVRVNVTCVTPLGEEAAST